MHDAEIVEKMLESLKHKVERQRKQIELADALAVEAFHASISGQVPRQHALLKAANAYRLSRREEP